MRTVKLILGLSLLICGVAYGQDYYWVNGKKVTLEKSDKKFVVLEKGTSTKSLSRIQARGSNVEQEGPEVEHGFLNKIEGVDYKLHSYAVLDNQNLKAKGQSKDVLYEGPIFKNKDGSDLIMTNFIYVRLKSKNDFKVLKKMASKYSATILGSNSTDESWYLLSSIGSGKTALELANIFFETGLVEAAEPEMLLQPKENCYNDSLYSDQWNADNTGQDGGTAGIDINLCEAHAITKGNGVIVAVLDQGVQYGHPDLPNLTSIRVFASNSAANGINGDHGMQCAGIIGAQGDNNIGMVGVAPDCQIMPAALVLNKTVTSTWPWGVASVMNLTWQNGADVISCSWSYINVASGVISSAITNSLNNGRNGLGSIVVFSTGNENSSAVSFPANTDDRILAVGAMSPCGERKNPNSCDGETDWGSNYGADLDLVAPGVKIPTVNLDGTYSPNFNGTSSAAPHVSGVAALILSVNPDLTVVEVNNIIEQTTQKVGGYNYQSTAARTNGSWNTEMGYGLLDAEAAVLAAQPTPPLFTTFNVPRNSAIPNGFKQFSNVHTIGTGGPDLSNVFNSVFNWWGSANNPNGLHQFTLETNNNTPRSYTNITDYGSYSIHNANPEITINSTIGFADLAGDYWVNLIGSDLVLVSKTGDYALYFSNSSSAPQVKYAQFEALKAMKTEGNQLTIAPNPFAESISIKGLDEDAVVTVYNSLGQFVESIAATNSELVLGSDYTPGIYIAHIETSEGTTKQTLIKQ